MSETALLVVWSDEAVEAVQDIYLYGTDNWSVELADAYLDRIGDVIEAISHNPLIGVSRDELKLGVRSFPVEQHIIYYRVRKNELTILTILHSRTDVRQRFK
jgi:toxin ParE1/3/4